MATAATRGDIDLAVSLEARIAQFEKAFQRAQRTSGDGWTNIERRATQGAQKLDTTFAQATRNVSNHFKLMATSAAGALSTALGVSELRKFADEWTAARSKIAAAGEEMENVGKRQSDLTDMANRSRSSIGAVVDLYTGLTRSTKEMGASQAQVLRVTENISKAFATSGASTDEVKGATLQLNQALASGALRGDELNSVMEQAPSLARLIAKEFGVTIGELKKLGEDGKLSADRVFKAILNGTAQIEAEFAKTTPTIAQSWQILTNSLTRYVGEKDEAIGASKAISGAITGLAENIDLVAPAAATLAAGLAAAFAGGPIIGGIVGATTALVGFSDKIHPIPGELASLADYAGVAWSLIKDKGGEAATYLQQRFAEAVDHISAALQSLNGSGMGDLLAAVKTLANGIIAAFDIAASTIKISFTSIGPIVAETMANAVNHTIADIEAMANKVIEAVNRIAKAFGQVGQISKIELGRVGNSFAGSSEQAGKAIGKAIRDAIGKDYIGDIGHGLQDIRDRANEAARKRQEAARPKPHDDGSINQPLTPGKDAEAEKKAQKQLADYDALVAKAREFVAAQAIERQAMQMDEQAASALKKEHEMLNAAKEKGIDLTDKQKEQIHSLAQEMAGAEQATKNFQDMQQSLRDLGDTITNELEQALDGLLSGSMKIEQVWKRLALLIAKMALEALLLGKGPLAGLFGTQNGGSLSGTAFSGSLGDALVKLFGPTERMQSAASAQSAVQSIARTATHATQASPTTPHTTSPVTPSAIKDAVEKAIPTPPSRPSDLTPSAPLPPRRPDLASDGLPAPVPPANIPNVGSLNGLKPNQLGSALRDKLTKDFGLSKAQASGVVGNLSAETDGFRLMQEMKPLVPGSRGGYGLAQWTGARRRQFEAFAKSQGKPVSDLDTQYAFLKKEIGGNEAWTGEGLPGFRRTLTPESSALYFRKYFERPGIPNDSRRLHDARQAFNAPGNAPSVDMTPTGSIQKAADQAKKTAEEAAQKAAEQAAQAQQRLAEQITRTQQVTQQIAQPLQGMDSGVTKLAGSLTQGVPATEGFVGELEKLIQQLLSGLGGGGGGIGSLLGGIGSIFGFAEGGYVSGPGGPTSDAIPAFLSNGEYVVNAKAAGKHGALLAAINEGKVPRLAMGGSVGIGSIASTYSPTVNISGMQDANRIAAKVGQAIAANAPDSFRRNREQQMAAAFRAMNRSHIRNG